MTVADLAAMLVAAAAGFAVAAVAARAVVAAAPGWAMRVNVRGRPVPAVLGAPVVAAALVSCLLVAGSVSAGWEGSSGGRVVAAVAVVVLVLGLAGWMDDRRGDETSRGFSGHLAALRNGRLTGGLLKMAAGGLAGAAAGLLLFPDDLAAGVATVLLVGLGANAINLFDRAPGRAAKVFFVACVPLMAFGDAGWAVAAAGLAGGLAACLPLDLGERAMLGDAGANPLGGVLGLGLALSAGGSGRWLAVMGLVALNAASERWSFSRTIEAVPWLKRVDRIGRK